MLIEAQEVDPDGATSYEPVDAIAINPDVYPTMHGVRAVSGDWGALHGDSMALGKSFASRYGLALGDTQRVRIDDATRDLEIVAILPVTMTGPDILLPPTMAPAGNAERLYLVETSGLDPRALRAELGPGGIGISGGVGVHDRGLDPHVHLCPT